MGTAEVPTAEVEYDGSICYAVGPIDRGVAQPDQVVALLRLEGLEVGLQDRETRASPSHAAATVSRELPPEELTVHAAEVVGSPRVQEAAPWTVVCLGPAQALDIDLSQLVLL